MTDVLLPFHLTQGAHRPSVLLPPAVVALLDNFLPCVHGPEDFLHGGYIHVHFIVSLYPATADRTPV